MTLDRREFLRASALAAALGPLAGTVDDAAEIVDTHQHLWEVPRQKLLWLESAPDVLRRSYTTEDYREATRGLNVVSAVYMEVDVDPSQHEQEADGVVNLARSGGSTTRAAVIGGRPAAAGFGLYLDRFREQREVKGVWQVLHSRETPAGYCLGRAFVEGIRELGRRGLAFDLCMRPGELADGLKLVEQCPETRFIIDHCGNADPRAFQPKPAGDRPPSHGADPWKRAMEGLAKHKNVACKISGIMAQAPKDWTADDLAPAINFCLDTFGPDRVVFGGDWPVCLLGSPYRGWVEALRAIVSARPLDHQRKLWHDNAVAFYGLAETGSRRPSE